MKSTTEHFLKFLEYLSSNRVVFSFPSIGRMRCDYNYNHFEFDIPVTVEGFNTLTYDLLPAYFGNDFRCTLFPLV